jgi:hypothetical protein
MSNPYEPDIVFGISPLGCNAVEGTSGADADVLDTTTHGVPLVFDDITGEYVAEIARTEQEDRIADLENGNGHVEEQRFLSQVGFQQSV